jgi:hypothetical protein
MTTYASYDQNGNVIPDSQMGNPLYMTSQYRRAVTPAPTVVQQPVQRAAPTYTPMPDPATLPSIALPNGQNPNLGNGLTASQQAFSNPNWMNSLTSKGGGMGPSNNIGTATPLGGLPQAGQYAAPVSPNFSNLALGPVQHAQAPNFNFQQQLQNFINSGLMR